LLIDGVYIRELWLSFESHSPVLDEAKDSVLDVVVQSLQKSIQFIPDIKEHVLATILTIDRRLSINSREDTSIKK
jgi:hypothetical protein